jgi:type IV pilus assembly protein PilE
MIELMVVVAVVAILAAIAYPGYLEHVRKGQITEATAILADTRIKMEQHFQDNNTYATACASNRITLPSAPANTKIFQFSCPSTLLGTATYTLRATSNDNGYVFEIDQNNTRRTTKFAGTTLTGANCWLFKKGDSC